MSDFDLATDLGMEIPLEAAETQPPPQEPTKAPTPGHPEPPQGEPKPEPEDKPKGEAIPMATALDWRDQMKAERRQREALELRLRELESQGRSDIPSATDDPEAFKAYLQEQSEQLETKTVLNMSLRFARKEYGQDAVEEASRWASDQIQSDPTFLVRFKKQDDPYGWVVDQHRKSQAIDRLGGKTLEDWALEYAQAQGYAVAQAAPPAVAQSQAPPPRQQAAPTRSLAAASSAGGPQSVPTHDGAAFEEVFAK